ncbi:MAG TPA: hypothetical protein VI653_08265 [Steroidobacteraceae bacterium]
MTTPSDSSWFDFTDEKTVSCMAGEWRRLEVLRRQFNDPDGFLATKPLSYIFEQGELTLGVTEVCDGYVFLRGIPTDAGLTGDYMELPDSTASTNLDHLQPR